MTAERTLHFAANWKMHHAPAAAGDFVRRFLEVVAPRAGRVLWFFPPAVSIATVAQLTRTRGDVRVGAQNVHWEPKGAFTGETSVAMAKEVGASGALVGHSERRHLFGETDEQSARKVAALVTAGLDAMLCVGERLEERDAGRTAEVVLRQLDAGLDLLPPGGAARLLLAYEPVWAIGTGRTAQPEDAAEVHRVLRARLEERLPGARPPILYGGSVTAANVLSLVARPEIDGVLVGGASLDPDGWAELVGLGD